MELGVLNMLKKLALSLSVVLLVGCNQSVSDTTEAAAPPPEATAALASGKYVKSNLQVNTANDPSACQISDWNCMDNKCKASNSSAWRGAAGCWGRSGEDYICYWDCLQVEEVQ